MVKIYNYFQEVQGLKYKLSEKTSRKLRLESKCLLNETVCVRDFSELTLVLITSVLTCVFKVRFVPFLSCFKVRYAYVPFLSCFKVRYAYVPFLSCFKVRLSFYFLSSKSGSFYLLFVISNTIIYSLVSWGRLHVIVTCSFVYLIDFRVSSSILLNQPQLTNQLHYRCLGRKIVPRKGTDVFVPPDTLSVRTQPRSVLTVCAPVT